MRQFRAFRLCPTRRFPGFIAILAFLTVTIASSTPAGAVTPNGRLQIIHLDVGQGDGAVLISPLGQVVMIDNGVNGNPTPASGVKVPQQLQALGVTHVNHHFASHYHADHIGCTGQIFGASGVSTLGFGWDRGQSYSSGTFTTYVNTLGNKRRTLVKGQIITLDSLSAHPVTIKCVDLAGAGTGTGDENGKCLVLKVSYGEFDHLFGGDLISSVETVVASAIGQVEAFKVHHHGSAGSSNATFLATIQAKIGVVSCGTGNSYGHPTNSALTRIHNAGTKTYWTETGSGVAPNPTWDKVSNNQVIISATWEPGGVDTVRGNGFTETFTNSGVASGPPVAAFTGTPTSGVAPLSVQFTDQSSLSPTSWSWDFGDGGTSTAQNPSHVYAGIGTYTVTLTAANVHGSDQEVKTNYINATVCTAPVAAFMGSPTSGTTPLTVQFTDQSTVGPTSWSWSFGDGGTSTAQNPSHAYVTAGTYNVTLTASNACGSDPEVKNGYITVTDAPPQVCDNFGDGNISDWGNKTGTWTATGGFMKQNSESYNVATTSPFGSYQSAILDCDVRMNSGQDMRQARVIFAWMNASNYRYIQGDDNGNTWRIYERVNGSDTQRLSVSQTISTGTWYHVTATLASNGNVAMAVNGATLGSYTFPTAVSGLVGCGASRSNVDFDNFCVSTGGSPIAAESPSSFQVAVDVTDGADAALAEATADDLARERAAALAPQLALRGVTARAVEAGMELRWTIGAADHADGFSVYRESADRSLVFAGHEADVESAGDEITFRFLDPGSRESGVYWLGVRACAGPEAMVGPIEVEAAGLVAANADLALRIAPNPVVGSTAFEFALARESDVRLEVFDLQGRCVATPVRGRRPAGPTRAEWDLRRDGGGAVAPGVYFARLQALGRTVYTRLTIVGR